MMTYTDTAVECRDGTLAAEHAIDDVLADSFPASDPPSWNAGVTRPESVAWLRHRARRSEPIVA